MKTKTHFILLPILLLLAGCATGIAATPPSPKAVKAKKSTTSIIQYPEIVVNRLTREIRIKAMSSDELHWKPSPIEFILISGRDRAYESLFVTKASPKHIWASLFLIGLQPGTMASALPKAFAAGRRVSIGGEAEKTAEKQRAHLIDVRVLWQEGEEGKSVRAESFLIRRSTNKPPKELAWAFTGSFFTTIKRKRLLAADLSRVSLSLLYDESSVMNLFYYEGSPYDEQNKVGFNLNTKYLQPYFLGEQEVFLDAGVVTIDGKPNKMGLTKVKIPIAKPVTIVLRPSTLKFEEPKPPKDPEPKVVTEKKEKP